MPSIAKAQAAVKLDDIGENRNLYTTVKLSVLEKIFVQYGAEFALKVREYLEQKNNIGSGSLADSTDPEVTVAGSVATLIIRLNDYYDFVNKGVKGVKSSKNAPNSPYQFKNYGMNAEGRKSIKMYIQSGKAKVETVRRSKDKALGIGREKKHLSLIDTQTNQLIFLIKRQGIKHTGYFDLALQDTLKDIEGALGQAVANDIVISLNKLNVSRN